MRLLVLPTVVMHHCCLQKYVPAKIINSQLAKGRSSSKTKRAPKQREKLMGLKCESSCIKEKFPVMKFHE
jgi:hypothetical protein